MRSAVVSTTSSRWLQCSTAPPRHANSCMSSLTTSVEVTSRPDSGSSNTNSFGSVSSAPGDRHLLQHALAEAGHALIAALAEAETVEQAFAARAHGAVVEVEQHLQQQELQHGVSASCSHATSGR